jgi:WD40 repeat protein
MFSSDGRYLATGSYDHTARVLEIESGNEVSRAVLDWPVRSINFASDGVHLSVTAAPSPGVNVGITTHFLHATDLIADACSRVTRNLTHEEWKQYVGTDVPYDKTCPKVP